MATLTIYHNPRCSKSRQTLALIEAAGITPNVIKYLDVPPSATEIKKLLAALSISPRELLRKGEDEYKSQNLARAELTDAQLIQAMATHPKLIERPIVTNGTEAVLGRPPENVNTLL